MFRMLFLLMSLLPFSALAQFSINNTAITIQAGAIFTIDSLSLQPSVVCTLASTQLIRAALPQTIGNGTSISQVYTFTNSPIFTGTVLLRYQDGALAGNVETGLHMAHSPDGSGNTWTIASGSTVNTATNTITTVLTSVFLARITASSASIPLPVQLIEFTAQKNERRQTALLEWKVTQEAGFDGYTIERSTNARDFTELGRVKAMAQSAYEFTDETPEEGVNYYRLKLNDLGGSFTYGPIRALSFGQKSVVFHAYPNPVKDEALSISTTDEASTGMAAVVYNLTGGIIDHFTLAGRLTTISTAAWIPGTYLLKLQNGLTFRIIKQ